MRRLIARPTSLSLGLAQQHPRDCRLQYLPWTARGQTRLFPGPLLDNDPQGIILENGKGPLKNRYPVLDVPDVLLDLVAVDSPYVRPYDQDKDGPAQHRKWSHDPNIDEALREAERLQTALIKQQRLTRKLESSPFPKAQVSDHDILSVALSAGVGAQPKDADELLEVNDSNSIPRNLKANLVENGIPEFIVESDANTILPFMLGRRRNALVALQDPLFCKKADESDTAVFKQTISACNSLEELRKLVSCIDNPRSGVELGPGSIDHVHRTLMRLLGKSSDSKVALEANLKFINNLTIKRLMRSKRLNRSMTLFGLQLSAKLGLLPSILQYLQICQSAGFIDHSSSSLSKTRIQVARAILRALQAGHVRTRGTCLQLFTLLTGQGPFPGDHKEPRASLLGLDKADCEARPEIYEIRVQLLAELGALSSLWLQYPGGADHTQLFVDAFRRSARLFVSAMENHNHQFGKTAAAEMLLTDAGAIQALEVFNPEGLVSEVEISEEEILHAFRQPDVKDGVQLFSQIIIKAAAQHGRED